MGIIWSFKKFKNKTGTLASCTYSNCSKRNYSGGHTSKQYIDVIYKQVLRNAMSIFFLDKFLMKKRVGKGNSVASNRNAFIMAKSTMRFEIDFLISTLSRGNVKLYFITNHCIPTLCQWNPFVIYFVFISSTYSHRFLGYLYTHKKYYIQINFQPPIPHAWYNMYILNICMYE